MLILTFLLGSILPNASANSLSLAEYLEQVTRQSPAVASSLQTIEGTLQSSQEGDLITMPKFTWQGSITRDERQQMSNFFGGKTHANSMTFGLEKQFDFGLNAKVSYNLLNNVTTDLTPLVYPNGENDYTSAQSELDLTLPLWRNFLGRETKASEAVATEGSLSNHYAERFHLKQLVAQAEGVYYHLAIAQETVQLLTDVLDRAKKIMDWNTKRVNQHLTDRVDQLQAQAVYQGRRLDLQNGLDDQRNAQLAFNTLRNKDSSEVSETLKPVSGLDLLTLAPPVRAAVTDDVKAAEATERKANADNELSLQKAQPDFSLFTNIGYNGLARFELTAVNNSFTTNHPLYVVGAKLSFPLYFWETSEIRSGRVKQQFAAEALMREKKLESETNGSDLYKKFDEIKNRLRLAEELVRLQDEKLKYERYRFNLGRTTTYQVLTFEQDYAQALISKLQIEQQLLAVYSQLKTYSEN